MSFVNVRNNTRSRFNENQILLNYITALEPRNVVDIIPMEVNVMKGLFYVHLYSSLEKSINELIEITLASISSRSVQFKHLNPAFYSISLVDKLKSFKDSGTGSFLNRAFQIFNESSSTNVCALNETILSNNLQNVWVKTIEEVCNSFGITSFSIPPGTRVTINELVDKRNAVAHGRESAKVVGERFRTDVIRTKMDLTIDFCNYLIDLFEEYYMRRNYLRPTAKRFYP